MGRDRSAVDPVGQGSIRSSMSKEYERKLWEEMNLSVYLFLTSVDDLDSASSSSSSSVTSSEGEGEGGGVVRPAVRMKDEYIGIVIGSLVGLVLLLVGLFVIVHLRHRNCKLLSSSTLE